jgi:hypothetical protein
MIALLLLAFNCFAVDGTEEHGDMSGELRLIGSTLSPITVDAEGTQLGQENWLDARIRLGATLPFFIGELETEWEISAPQLLGDLWDIPGLVDERGRDARMLLTLPRKLNLSGRVANFHLQAGLNTSHWGLGLLANDGAHPDWWGRSDFGDRVIRLRATRLPFSDGPPKAVEMFFTTALDLVVADEMARLEDDQLTGQAIASLLWRHRNENQWGVYSVVRHQVERDRTRSTTALVVDGFADVTTSLGDWTLRTAAEAAVILGVTNRATTYNARQRQNIAQLGATGLLALQNPSDSMTVRLRAGYASGDGDPDDAVAHDFGFDRDFSAGVVMFDQLSGGIEAATYSLLTDPDLAGKPPDAVDALVTEGTFRRAVFVQPAIEFKPISWVAARVGATLSWSTGPIRQPYYSHRAGGTARNHLNTEISGRGLGTEVNWSVSFEELGEGSDNATQFEVQAGHLFVGEAYSAGGGQEVIHHVMGIVRQRW